MTEVLQPCCDIWGKAQERGTDHEGYGPALITRSCWAPDYEPRSCLLLGSELPDARFCPWCGAPKLPERKEL